MTLAQIERLLGEDFESYAQARRAWERDVKSITSATAKRIKDTAKALRETQRKAKKATKEVKRNSKQIKKTAKAAIKLGKTIKNLITSKKKGVSKSTSKSKAKPKQKTQPTAKTAKSSKPTPKRKAQPLTTKGTGKPVAKTKSSSPSKKRTTKSTPKSTPLSTTKVKFAKPVKMTPTQISKSRIPVELRDYIKPQQRNYVVADLPEGLENELWSETEDQLREHAHLYNQLLGPNDVFGAYIGTEERGGHTYVAFRNIEQFWDYLDQYQTWRIYRDNPTASQSLKEMVRIIRYTGKSASKWQDSRRDFMQRTSRESNERKFSVASKKARVTERVNRAKSQARTSVRQLRGTEKQLAKVTKKQGKQHERLVMEQARSKQLKLKSAKLAAKLRSLGINPDNL